VRCPVGVSPVLTAGIGASGGLRADGHWAEVVARLQQLASEPPALLTDGRSLAPWAQQHEPMGAVLHAGSCDRARHVLREIDARGYWNAA
jgi:hypothetical protein